MQQQHQLTTTDDDAGNDDDNVVIVTMTVWVAYVDGVNVGVYAAFAFLFFWWHLQQMLCI